MKKKFYGIKDLGVQVRCRTGGRCGLFFDKDVSENLPKPSAGHRPSAQPNALVVHRSPFNSQVAEPPARNPRSGKRIQNAHLVTIYGSGSLP